MPKFRKRPVVIEAVQLPFRDADDLPLGMTGSSKIIFKREGRLIVEAIISTLEGTMIANRQDWIIKGVKGELYPCKPDIFAATYELILSEGADG